jgi:2-hydroxychromene-2-carboxylate isomerase
MIPTIEFYFDFGSPNAYLAYRVVPAIDRSPMTARVRAMEQGSLSSSLHCIAVTQSQNRTPITSSKLEPEFGAVESP